MNKEQSEQITEPGTDPFADLAMNKEEALTAMIWRSRERGAVIADLRQQITALLKAQADAVEDAYQKGYEAGRKAAGEL